MVIDFYVVGRKIHQQGCQTDEKASPGNSGKTLRPGCGNPETWPNKNHLAQLRQDQRQKGLLSLPLEKRQTNLCGRLEGHG